MINHKVRIGRRKWSATEEMQAVPIEKRKRWHDALVSGDYEQTTGLLYRKYATEDIPAGYCCLGVLQKAYNKPVMRRDRYNRRLGPVGLPSDTSDYVSFEGKSLAIIPLAKWYDRKKKIWHSVTPDTMNDVHLATFAQIAELVYPEAYV